MGSYGAKAPKRMKFVGVGVARAARAAGFEVGGKHLAEHARFEYIGCPTRRARGNSSLPGLNKRLLSKR